MNIDTAATLSAGQSRSSRSVVVERRPERGTRADSRLPRLCMRAGRLTLIVGETDELPADLDATFA